MIKDQRIRSGIAIYNILQFHLILYRQLFNVLLFPVCFRIIADAFIPDLLLQVVAHSHKERFKVGNGCEIVVDPVCTGDQPHGHYGKRCKLRHDLCGLCSSKQPEHHIQDHPGDRYAFNDHTGSCVIQVIALYGIHIAGATFSILINKIIFLGCDFDLLDPHHRLVDPLVQSAVILLVFFAGLFHDRL